MKFDLSTPNDLKQAKTHFKALCEAQNKIELKAIKNKRSLSQNAYLHVVITLYAIYFGSTLNEAKTDLKRGCSFMVYEKNGSKYLKETSKMDSKELTEFIEWIRNFAAENGCYIPTSEEYLQNKFSIDKDIDNNKKYL
jgi:deoxycytidine triphosphate deaminase